MVIPYHQDLYRALEGPVNMEREERGQFTIRRNPVHIGEILHARRQAEARRVMDLQRLFLDMTQMRIRLERNFDILVDEGLANDVRVI